MDDLEAAVRLTEAYIARSEPYTLRADEDDRNQQRGVVVGIIFTKIYEAVNAAYDVRISDLRAK